MHTFLDRGRLGELEYIISKVLDIDFVYTDTGHSGRTSQSTCCCECEWLAAAWVSVLICHQFPKEAVSEEISSDAAIFSTATHGPQFSRSRVRTSRELLYPIYFVSSHPSWSGNGVPPTMEDIRGLRQVRLRPAPLPLNSAVESEPLSET